jgi:uncharacterized protein YkwD
LTRLGKRSVWRNLWPARRAGFALALAGAALTAAAQVSERRPASDAPAQTKGGQVLEADPTPLQPALLPETKATLERINAYRAAGAACGGQAFPSAPPLAWNPKLERAAEAHARDMAARRVMSHTGGDGSSVSQRVQRQQYEWGSVGENVSAGYRTVSDALAGWMKSPGHCSNMMSTAFTEVAVGAAFTNADTFGWYRAMVLGRPLRGAAAAEAAGPAPAAAPTAGATAPAAPATNNSSPVQVAAASPTTAPNASLDPGTVVDTVNALRRGGVSCKGRAVAPAPPLRWDSRLESVAAARHSGDRASTGELASRAGLSWTRIQEIAGASAAAPAELLRRWSSEFCDALLSPDYTLIAFAAGAADTGSVRAWMLILARE